jgi:hypothetical protein
VGEPGDVPRSQHERLVIRCTPPWKDRTLREILQRARHDGGGGSAGRAELLTGIEGVSSHPVRRIVLLAG